MQKKTGISLIVLVITIIVMTILAGAIILTLNNSGIIEKATDAVEESNLATVKELTQMAWAEAYAGGERTEEGLKAAVDKALADNKVDTSKYVIEVTTSGVNVELKGEETAKWVQEGLTVTNGKITLEIGDSIAYDETAGGTITGLTATEWQVLGASETGELLILSTETIGNIYIFGVDAYANGPTYFNEACEPYGKGEGATGIRAVEVEDIDKITGIDKTTYGKGMLHEFGNEVTFKWAGNDGPSYTTSNGLSGNVVYTPFYWFEGTQDYTSTDEGATAENPITITTLTNNYYTYDASNLTTLDTSSKAYTMLFGEYQSENKNYILASRYFTINEHDSGNYGEFGLFCVNYGSLRDFCCIWTYDRGIGDDTVNVRAVVSLASEIQLVGNSTEGWSF